ncbi:hypothetical protein Pdw03_8377 [Penicillium digitatum]|uniref:Uncharacterized protein n=1 Tax=Penicillium digitatum TaxID=36651 RepID=A0A7T7BLT2_PENDI|nr:hypothetical protein Pdw03_8377 [Penicillium digitatum]
MSQAINEWTNVVWGSVYATRPRLWGLPLHSYRPVSLDAPELPNGKPEKLTGSYGKWSWTAHDPRTTT